MGIVVGDRVLRVDGVALQAAVNARLNSTLAAAPAAANADEGALHGEKVAWAVLSLLAGRADAARRFTVADPQGRLREVALPVQRRFDRPAGALSVRQLPRQLPRQLQGEELGQIGVIRFNNSLGEQSTVAAFDAALAGLHSARGLVLDLRDVPSGGNSSVALGMLGRFVHKPLVYQQHRIPNYGQADVQRSWLELVSPRGAFIYDGPVVVLVNHWTGSMGEGMALGFDAMQRASVVGTSMAHRVNAGRHQFLLMSLLMSLSLSPLTVTVIRCLSVPCRSSCIFRLSCIFRKGSLNERLLQAPIERLGIVALAAPTRQRRALQLHGMGAAFRPPFGSPVGW